MHTKLIEITQVGPDRAGIIDIPERYWPEPGQYLPCQRVDEHSDPLPTYLFRFIDEEGVLNLSPIPVVWQPGDHLWVSTAQGHGFSLPGDARRLALLPYKVSPTRLMTLIRQALTQNASISLFYETFPHPDIMDCLQSAVEVNPLSALLDNLDWPDYLAVDLAQEDLREFSGLFRQIPMNLNGQVLVRIPMPCHGIGECGVCAVLTKHGWKLACKDGPVFPLEELLDVAH